MKEKRNFIIKLTISVSLIAIIFYGVDKESFLNNFRLLDYGYVPFIILLLVTNYLVSSYRWKTLLIHKNSERVSVKYLTYLYFTGAFFNNFMPTSIGGDVYKVYKLGKKLGDAVDAFSATFMERFTGVVALGLISVFSLVKMLGIWGALILIVFVVGILIGFYLLSFLSSRSEKVRKLYHSLNAYRGKNKILLWAFITSFIVQFLAIATQYFVFLALGIKLPIVYALFIFPVITLAGFFIPSLNGIGVQDALYMKLFAVVGVLGSLSLSASLVYHLFRLGVSLIGGVIYALGKDA